MKIAFVTNGVPRLNYSGASDICYTLAKEFKIKKYDVQLHVVSHDVDRFKANDENFYSKIYNYSYNNNILSKILKNPFLIFFPNKLINSSLSLTDAVKKNIYLDKPNLIFIYHWQPAAPFLDIDIPKIVISGDLLFFPRKIRTFEYKKLGLKVNFLKFILKFIFYFYCKYYEKKLMIKCINTSDIGGSYGYFDAKWLRENGALKSQYFKTPIIDAYPEFDIKKIEVKISKKYKIITGTSNLQSTSTLAGLNFLDKEILKNLLLLMDEKDFEIHIIGKGNISSDFKNILSCKSVFIRGFVEDLKTEYESSHLVLIPTNVFLGYRSRVLTAFSYSACVVAHSNDAINQPEMIHKENCFIANDGPGIAENIFLALNDNNLRKKIKINARETYLKNFHPKVAMPKIFNSINAAVKKS